MEEPDGMREGITCGRPPTRLEHLRLIEVSSVAILLVLGWLDYITGYEFGFFIFYFIPVSITTWYAGRWSGLAMACASAVAYYLSDVLAHHPYSKGFFLYWETFMRLVSFLTTALTLHKIRELVSARVQLRDSLREAHEEIADLRQKLVDAAFEREASSDPEPTPSTMQDGTSEKPDWI